MDFPEIFSKELLTVTFTLFAVINIIGAVPVLIGNIVPLNFFYFVCNFIHSVISFNTVGEIVCSIAEYSVGEPVLHS